MNRKEMIRQYKETPRMAGVFRVRSVETGLELIGRSVDVPSMLNRQRAQLRMGSHRDRALQAAWKEHGAEGFTFEVLDTLEPGDEPGYDPEGDLAELEAMWREKLAAGRE